MIIVLPTAGGDEAFKDRGFPYCKPLTEIHGKPLIEHVWRSLAPLSASRHVFVIRKEDAKRAHLGDVLRLMDPDCAVIATEGPTAGAACTALLAIEQIDPERELVISNGDQVLTCDMASAVADFRRRDLDGGTLIFDSVHPRWSFVRIGENSLVTEAAEKRPISRHATAGFYYFKRGRDFIRSAQEMIRKDAHVDGAFYVCPAFNEMILRHARIGVYPISRTDYVSLANPQNVEEYEQSLTSGARSGVTA